MQNLAGNDDSSLKAQKNMKYENFAIFTGYIFFFFFKRVTNLSIMLSYETFFRLSNPQKMLQAFRNYFAIDGYELENVWIYAIKKFLFSNIYKANILQMIGNELL